MLSQATRRPGSNYDYDSSGQTTQEAKEHRLEHPHKHSQKRK